MNQKCVLVLLATILLFALAAYGISAHIILPPFLFQEQLELTKNLDRCESTLKAQAQELHRLTKDWAAWDDSYTFVQDGNKAYIAENLGWDYLEDDLSLNALYIVDLKGHSIWGETNHPITEKSHAFEKVLLDSISPGGKLFKAVLGDKPVMGLLSDSENIWLLAANQVLPSSGEGDANGIMVMAKAFSVNDFKGLSKQLKIGFSLQPSEKTSPPTSKLVSISKDPRESTYLITTSDTVLAYRNVDDLLNPASVSIAIEVPRNFYNQGEKAAFITAISIFLVGIIIAFLLAKLTCQTLRLLTIKNELIVSLEEKTQALSAYEVSEKERSELEIRLRQKYKMEALGTMAGGIAHDFNNILAIILGNAIMLQQSFPAESRSRKNINNLLSAAQRAGDLVKQILSFSRQEKPLLHPIDLSSTIEESIDLLRSTIPTSIEIQKNIAPGLWINADETQLQQALLNLCSNATHAMDGLGILSLKGEERIIKVGELPAPNDQFSGRFVHLSITDTGTGMTAEVLERIFDPFYTTKDAAEGTGMGLSVVMGVVENHGGIIDVESAENKGSTFHLYFPLCDASSVKTLEPTDLPLAAKEHILIVDDEEMLVQVASEMLEHLGYTVTTETCSPNALATIEENPDLFDLIITDKTMPKLSGFELATRINKIRANLPIILCSGFLSDSIDETNLPQEIKAFCSKPLDLQQFARTVRDVLDGKAE